MKKLITILFLFNTAYATTYYIRTDGNNGNAGTTNSAGGAWLTLVYAATQATGSGDLIRVIAGTYLETSQVVLSVGVSIEGDGVTSIIQSTVTTYAAGLITASSAEGTNGNQSISFLKFDGRSLITSVGVDFKGRRNVSVHDCTFQDFDLSGCIITGQDDNAPGAPSVYAVGNSFYNNTLTNCSKCDGATGFGSFMYGGTDGMLIYNNTITTNSRATNTNGWPIKGWCDGHDKGTKIYNNTLTTQPIAAGNANGTNGFWDFAIELFFETGIEIYNNTITGSIDMNFQYITSYPYSVWIHDNVIGFSTLQVGRQSGIILEFDTETAIIENNTIRNCVDGIIFSMRALNHITNTTIRKNLIYNIGEPAGGYGYGIGNFTDGSSSYTIDSLYIYNNTILAHSNTSYAPFYGISFGNAGSINQWNLKNNIVQGFQDGCIISGEDTSSNSTCQYNDFYLNAHSNAPFTTFAGENIPTGMTVSNNLQGNNPLFVGGTDYSLQAASPCMNTGINVGLSYCGSAPNIGYWEENCTFINGIKRKRL